VNKKLLRDALRIAREKLPRHPEKGIGAFLHTSFIVLEGKIVSYGFNRSHEPAVHLGYGSRLTDKDQPPKTHAEMTAWTKARGLIGNRRFHILNVRLNRDGAVKMSEPCPVCAQLFPILGCCGFYYTNTLGGWSKLVP
jgi:tRNA(Arg) A34 adenosine deaminase TadA